jgi:putative transposase
VSKKIPLERYYDRVIKKPFKEVYSMNKIILDQFLERFKEFLEEIMVNEREDYLKEHRDTRGNGFYKRNPKTMFGEMELDIPRTRDGNFKPSILPERKRVTFMLDEIVRALFYAGLSSRKTGEVVKNLFGSSVSSSFISSNLNILEEVIERFKNRELIEEYPVLIIDATYVPIRRDSVEKEAVYAVIGLRKDGKREILSYFIPGGNEKASVWKDMFVKLKKQGLKEVKMIISDDLSGLEEAIQEVFPEVEHQLCWFHLKSNIKKRVRKKHFEEIMKDLEYVLTSPDEETGRKRLEEFIAKWSKLYRFLKYLRKKVNNYCYFLKFPFQLRSSYTAPIRIGHKLEVELK